MKKPTLFAFLITSYLSFSQSATKTVFVKYIDKPITIDAVLDEPEWQEAQPATNFWEYFPTDTLQAKQQAEIKMLFDDNNLYVGMKVNSSNNKFIVPSLRRDFRAGGNDNISLIFDTFNDGTNAYLFGTNPYGVLREALIAGGGIELRDFNTQWDTKWIGKSAIHKDYYIVEWKIPLSSFKYREGETKWRFNSYHFDTKDNERNTWIHIPQNQNIFSLAYMGDMIFEKPLGKSKSPITIIPYLNGIVGRDFENSESASELKIGGDAKLTIGNSMNLDITVNPDFSQVEADQLVTNLSRYEVSLPEQRQFFIENSDLFGDLGNSRDANPFFSRRIGIVNDSLDEPIENKIIGGVRLSGKVNNTMRLGILDMQASEDLENKIPTTNNMVVTVQQKLFSRSNISVSFINKQPTKNYDFLANEDQYNRVLGIDYKLASHDNTWVGKYYFHKSFSPNTNSKDISSGASTEYSSRNYNIRLDGLFIGENFRSDLGYIRRTDILKVGTEVQRSFWPSHGSIQKHGFAFHPIIVWMPSLQYINSDYRIATGWNAKFQNTSEFKIEYINRFTRLYEAFDPTDTDGAIPLPENTGYYYSSLETNYKSDLRQSFSYDLSASIGKFFNGHKYSLHSKMALRIQPYFTSSIAFNYDRINLPDPYASASIWLIGPKVDITFNKHVFWSTFVQYSSQSQNFSINSRFQWEFAPLSDLYIVYNDNYFADGYFAPRFRSLNLKLTYWLTI